MVKAGGPTTTEAQALAGGAAWAPCLIGAHLAALAMQVTDGAQQGVRAQDNMGALGPLRADQRVLTQQDLADVLSTSNPHYRPAQKVGLEDVSVPLPPGAVEAGALGTSRRSAQGSCQALPIPLPSLCALPGAASAEFPQRRASPWNPWAEAGRWTGPG